MAGIAGIAQTGKQAQVNQMLDRIAYRGGTCPAEAYVRTGAISWRFEGEKSNFMLQFNRLKWKVHEVARLT